MGRCFLNFVKTSRMAGVHKNSCYYNKFCVEEVRMLKPSEIRNRKVSLTNCSKSDFERR